MKYFLILFIALFGFKTKGFAQVSPAQYGREYSEFIQYLDDNLKTSKRAKRKKFDGEINVAFRVSSKGVIDSVWFDAKDDYKLHGIISELLLGMPNWRPAYLNGNYVTGIINEKIKFESYLSVKK